MAALDLAQGRRSGRGRRRRLRAAIVAGISYAYANTAVPSDAAQAATQQQSTVYFSDGKTAAGTFGSTDRQVLTYNQISPYMRDAVVAAEDRGFYTEGGVSPKGIMRAAYEDVFKSGGSGGSLQGGSTITQQFVRNYYANIGTQQTATRKIKEIFVALKVAKEKSKAWILTQVPEHHLSGRGRLRGRRRGRDLLRRAGFASSPSPRRR